MERTMFITVSDDRFGRKDGKYTETQNKIEQLINNNPGFGITDMKMWKWAEIETTPFYFENEILLKHKDPSKNGRAYKPYTIVESLKMIDDGDYLIYNDCSPEIWPMDSNYKLDPALYQLNILKELCKGNGDILTAHVKWNDRIHVENGIPGYHTHEFFTSERCMRRMGLEQYRYSLQHASGFVVLRKSERSVAFAEEWLKWNLIDECGSLGPATDDTFWGASWEQWMCDEHKWDEVFNIAKLGHRHDQSVSGLLINKMNNKIVETLDWYQRPPGIHAYWFPNFCKVGHNFHFFDSNQPAGEFVFLRDIKTMEVVRKKRG